MKLFIITIMLSLAIPAWANKTGLGISLGNPTGLNGKYWLDDDKAIDAGLGMSFGKNSDLSIHSDYLLHSKSALYVNEVHPLDLYYGLGGRMEFADDIELGVRVPVGVLHTMENDSADMFAEVAPVVDLFSKFGVEIHLLFGARYYFQ